MRFEHFMHLMGIGAAAFGVMNLIQGQAAVAIFMFVAAVVAFGVGYLLQRRRSG